jgi:hypothetical protein
MMPVRRRLLQQHQLKADSPLSADVVEEVGIEDVVTP